MGYTLKFNGVPTLQAVGTLSITQVLNDRDTLKVDIVSADGSVRPQQDDQVTATEDGDSTAQFGGLVNEPTLGGYLDDSHTSGAVQTGVQAVDFKAYAGRRTVSVYIPAGNVKAAATAIIPYLTTYGIVLIGTQVNGPAIPAQDFRNFPYALAALDAIALAAGPDWAWRVTPALELEFFQLSQTNAPFNIADGDGHCNSDLKITPDRSNYANRVIVQFNSKAIAAYAFLHVAANFADGDTVVIGSTTYTLQATLTDSNGHVQIGGSVAASIDNLVAAITLGAGAGTAYAASTTANTSVTAYRYDPSTMKVIAITPGAAGNSIGVSTTAGGGTFWFGEGVVPLSTLELGADQALTSTAYSPRLPTDPPNPVEAVVQTDTTDLLVAEALADAIKAVKSLTPRKAEYSTFVGAGLRVGQKQTINSTIRFVNADFTITEIVCNELLDSRVLRRVTAMEGALNKGSWRDTYKLWAGAAAASQSVGAVSSGGGTTGGSTTVAARTVYYLGGDGIQWQRSGTPTWVPVAGPADPGGGQRGGAIEVVIDTAAWGSTVGTVVCRLKAKSGSVTARLRNLDDGTTAGTSAAITNTNFQLVTFTVNLTTGSRAYRLELLPSVANVDVAGVGYLQ